MSGGNWGAALRNCSALGLRRPSGSYSLRIIAKFRYQLPDLLQRRKKPANIRLDTRARPYEIAAEIRFSDCSRPSTSKTS